IDDDESVARVLRTGQPALSEVITPEQLAAAVHDGHQLEVVRALAPLSYMTVPLVARGRTLGAVSFLAGVESGRHYGPHDLTLAEELARRAAIAVDNARLYHEAQQAVKLR